jgi:hypothetical protein
MAGKAETERTPFPPPVFCHKPLTHALWAPLVVLTVVKEPSHAPDRSEGTKWTAVAALLTAQLRSWIDARSAADRI